ncbi:MAG: hypothetical protein RLZZ70_499, partial [Candidatus Parcubacteria bacterium]
MKSFEFNKEKNIATKRQVDEVVSGEMITSQFFGDITNISRLDLRFGNHTRTLVLKDYELTNVKSEHNEGAQESAIHSLIVWEHIRSLGLPTYTTYRLENNGTAILMTDLETDGYSALSFNHAPPDWYQDDSFDQRIHAIENFDTLIEETKKCARISSESGIVLDADVYFVLVKETQPNSYRARIFVGDFEGVSLPETDSRPALLATDDYETRDTNDTLSAS